MIKSIKSLHGLLRSDGIFNVNGTEELYKLGESALLNTIDPPLSPGILKMAGVFQE